MEHKELMAHVETDPDLSDFALVVYNIRQDKNCRKGETNEHLIRFVSAMSDVEKKQLLPNVKFDLILKTFRSIFPY